MADKLKQGIAVVPTFVDGEQPSAAKLNSLGAQLKRAAEQLEKAVGDTLNQSYPYTSLNDTRLSQAWGRSIQTGNAFSGTTERNLDIVNIARLIGPASNLNPAAPTVTTSVTENTPVGVHEFALRYVPSDVATVTFSDAVVFATLKTDKANLQVDGDYHVTNDGKVYCVLPSTAGTVTYSVDPVLQNGVLSYQGATFNVIPDPNQLTAGGNGLAFGTKDAANRYPVTLPTVTHYISDIEGTSSVLDDDDLLYGEQLKLPKVLTDNFSPGEEIPEGFLLLKNFTTNQLYETATYYYDTESTLLIGGIDIDDEIAAGHQFYLITVGTNITTSIDDLRRKAFHSHDRTHGEPFVKLDSVVGFTQEASTSGVFVPSEIPGNFAPQYLHRDGSTVGIDGNLNDDNAMRGPLLMGVQSGSPGSYAWQSGAAFPIYFGNTNTKLEKLSDSSIEVKNTDGDINLTTTENCLVEAGSALGGSIRFRVNGVLSGIYSEARHYFESGYNGGDGGLAIKVYANEETIVTPSTLPNNVQLPNVPTDVTTNYILGITGFIKAGAIGYTWIAPNRRSSASEDYWWTFTLESIGSDGNVPQVYFYGPGWNPSTSYQVRFVIWYV